MMEMLTVLDSIYTGAKSSGFVKVFGFLVFHGYGLLRFLHCPASHSDCQTYSTTVIPPILFCDFFTDLAVDLKTKRGSKFMLELFAESVYTGRFEQTRIFSNAKFQSANVSRFKSFGFIGPL